MSGTHGLDLGTLDLASSLPHESGCTFSVIAAGTSFGSPDAAVKSLVSMLADGDLVTYDRAGNREASFQVQIDGPDGQALADGEVALRRELYRPNTVTWSPPADFGPATVFEVLTSSMEPRFDDIDELQTRRVFQVTLTCAPFARSVDPVTVDSLPPPPVTPVTATVTNADTTTGFTATLEYQDSFTRATSPVTVTDQGAYVQATATGVLPTLRLSLAVASTSMASTPYLLVEASGTAGATFSAILNGVSTEITPTISRATTAGTVVYVLDTGGRTLTGLTVACHLLGSAPQAVTLNIHDVTRTDTLPQVSKRQITRVLPGRGTERTPGSIHVSAATNLGVTAVHTSPADGSGYSPPLRRWRVAGGSTVNTTDPGPFSGARELISSSFHAKVPTSALPEGGYQMIAVLRCPTTTTVPVFWDIWTIPPGASTDAERQGNVSGNKSVSFTAGVWALVVLAEDVTLPTLRTKAGQVEVFVGGGSGVELDEVWLFRTDDDCALTYVNVTEPNLWLDSPSPTSPVPTVWVGPSRANSAHPGTNLAGMGTHVLHPDGTTLFTATSAVDNPAASAEFYPRWHSNAAE